MNASGMVTMPWKCKAPWPDDSTCGVCNASSPTARPPSAGRSGGQATIFDSSVSQSPAPRMIAMPNSAAKTPSKRRHRKVAPQDDADQRTGADAERQRRKGVGDKIADDGGNPDRRQARGRIAADHELESIERARQRRAEGAGDGSGRAASDHQALVGAAQMKSAADRSAEPARELGISGLKPDRRADPAGPDRLQRHDHAAAKRHPAAMQGIGLDRVDFTRRPNAQQQQKRDPQQEPAKASEPEARAADRSRPGWKGGHRD